MLFPQRWTNLVVSTAMAIYMVTIMTFLITLVNTGFDAEFFQRWWRAYYIAFPVAFALLLLGGPKIRQLATKLIKPA